jgi:[ribosomal protein S18]-alanine N-acetyltransferase
VVSTEKGIVRTVESGDRTILADLLHSSSLIHRHLDWRPPLEWLPFRPFLVYEISGKVCACLACPIHPKPVAWLRLFMVHSPRILETAWQALWPEAIRGLAENQAGKAAALPGEVWLSGILEKQGFRKTNHVVSLIWKNQQPPPKIDIGGCSIRSAMPDDLPMIAAVDAAAFDLMWQQPLDDLELAFEQAAIASVVDVGNTIVGYQISTASALGGHLARLAIHPDFQRKGYGKMLLVDLLKRFIRRGSRWLTVNTQKDNAASLALYDWAGFALTGESYPVYELDLTN